MIKKITSFLIIISLLFSQTGFAQDLSLPVYPPLVIKQEALRLEHLRGIGFNPLENHFNLVLDKGDSRVATEEFLKKSADKLFEYFLIGIRLPNESFWVNLRPGSVNDVIDELLARTDIGKVMLETDVKLKKELALFTSVRTQEGKDYWDKIYAKAKELYGTNKTEIPTTTRLWIVPNEVFLRENGSDVYIYKASLMVMLDADYIKTIDTDLKDSRLKELNEYSAQIIREGILPKITKRVNTIADFASLRQVYYSLILAQWFKQAYSGKHLADSLNLKIDSKDLTGLVSKKTWDKETYFKEYEESFKNKEFSDSQIVTTQEGRSIRYYATGGEEFTDIPVSGKNVVRASASLEIPDTAVFRVKLADNGERVISKQRDESDDGGLFSRRKAAPPKSSGIPLAKYITWRKLGLVDGKEFNLKNLNNYLDEILSADPSNISALITRQADNIKQSILELVSNASDAQTQEHIGRFGMGALQQLVFVNEGGQVNVDTVDSTGKGRQVIFFKSEENGVSFDILPAQRKEQGTANTITVPKKCQPLVPDIEGYLREKLKFFTKMPVYINGELINPLDSYIYLDGDIVKYEYPQKKIDIYISKDRIIIEDMGKGMSEETVFDKYLIPRLGENSPIPPQQSAEEIRKQVHVFYHSALNANNNKCVIVFKVSGVGIQSFEVEGEHLPDNLVIELPSSTRLQVSRNEIEINASTRQAVEALAEKIVDKSPIHQADLINAFMLAVKLLDQKNKRVDSSKPLVDAAKDVFIPYILKMSKEKNIIFLPNNELFRQIEIPRDRNIMFLDESLVYGLSPEQIPNARDLKDKFKPGSYKKAYIVPFKPKTKSLYVSFGPYLLINERIYEKWKKYPMLMNLRLNFYIGYGRRNSDKGWILAEEQVKNEESQHTGQKNLNIYPLLQKYRNLNEFLSEKSLHILGLYAQRHNIKEEDLDKLFSRMDKFVGLVPENLRLTLDWNNIFMIESLMKRQVNIEKEIEMEGDESRFVKVFSGSLTDVADEPAMLTNIDFTLMPDREMLELHAQFFANQDKQERIERYLKNLLIPGNITALKLSPEDNKYLHWLLACADNKALAAIDYEVLENIIRIFKNKNLESMEDCFKAINQGLKNIDDSARKRLILRWMRIYNNNPKSAESFYQMMIQEYAREQLQGIEEKVDDIKADPAKAKPVRILEGGFEIEGISHTGIILKHGPYSGKLLAGHGGIDGFLGIFEVNEINKNMGKLITNIKTGTKFIKSVVELDDGRIIATPSSPWEEKSTIVDLRSKKNKIIDFESTGGFVVLGDGKLAVGNRGWIDIIAIKGENQVFALDKITVDGMVQDLILLSDGRLAAIVFGPGNEYYLEIYEVESKKQVYSMPVGELPGIKRFDFIKEFSPGILMIGDKIGKEIIIIEENNKNILNKIKLNLNFPFENIVKITPTDFIGFSKRGQFFKLEFEKIQKQQPEKYDYTKIKSVRSFKEILNLNDSFNVGNLWSILKIKGGKYKDKLLISDYVKGQFVIFNNETVTAEKRICRNLGINCTKMAEFGPGQFLILNNGRQLKLVDIDEEKVIESSDLFKEEYAVDIVQVTDDFFAVSMWTNNKIIIVNKKGDRSVSIEVPSPTSMKLLKESILLIVYNNGRSLGKIDLRDLTYKITPLNIKNISSNIKSIELLSEDLIILSSWEENKGKLAIIDINSEKIISELESPEGSEPGDVVKIADDKVILTDLKGHALIELTFDKIKENKAEIPPEQKHLPGQLYDYAEIKNTRFWEKGINLPLSGLVLSKNKKYKGRLLAAKDSSTLSIIDLEKEKEITSIKVAVGSFYDYKELDNGNILVLHVSGGFSIIDLSSGNNYKLKGQKSKSHMLAKLSNGYIVSGMESIDILNQDGRKVNHFDMDEFCFSFTGLDNNRLAVNITRENKTVVSKILLCDFTDINQIKKIGLIDVHDIIGRNVSFMAMEEFSPGILFAAAANTVDEIFVIDYKQNKLIKTLNIQDLVGTGYVIDSMIKKDNGKIILGVRNSLSGDSVSLEESRVFEIEFEKMQKPPEDTANNLDYMKIKSKRFLEKSNSHYAEKTSIILKQNNKYKGKLLTIKQGNNLSLIDLKEGEEVFNTNITGSHRIIKEVNDRYILIKHLLLNKFYWVDFPEPRDHIAMDLAESMLDSKDALEGLIKNTKLRMPLIGPWASLSNDKCALMVGDMRNPYIAFYELLEGAIVEEDMFDINKAIGGGTDIRNIAELQPGILLLYDDLCKEFFVIQHNPEPLAKSSEAKLIGRFKIEELGRETILDILSPQPGRVILILKQRIFEFEFAGKQEDFEDTPKEMDYTKISSAGKLNFTLNKPKDIVVLKNGKDKGKLLVIQDGNILIDPNRHWLKKSLKEFPDNFQAGDITQLKDGRFILKNRSLDRIDIYKSIGSFSSPPSEAISINGVTSIVFVEEVSSGILAISCKYNGQYGVVFYDLENPFLKPEFCPIHWPVMIRVLKENEILVCSLNGDLYKINFKNKMSEKILEMPHLFDWVVLSEDLIAAIRDIDGVRKLEVINIRTSKVETGDQKFFLLDKTKHMVKLEDGRLLLSEDGENANLFLVDFFKKEKQESPLGLIRSGFEALDNRDDLSGLPALVKIMVRFLRDENVDIIEEEEVKAQDPGWVEKEEIVGRDNPVSLAMINYIFEKNSSRIKDEVKKFDFSDLKGWILSARNKNFKSYLQIVLSAIEGQDRTERAWIREVGVQNPRDAIRGQIREGKIKEEGQRNILHRNFINNHKWVYSIEDPVGMGLWELMRYYFPLDQSSKDYLLDTGNLGQGNYTLFADFDEIFIRTSDGEGLIHELQLINDKDLGPVIISWKILEGRYKGTEIRRIKDLANSDPQLESLFIQEALQKYAGLIDDVGIIYNGKGFKEDLEVTDRVKLSDNLGEVRIGRLPKKYARQRVAQDGIFVKSPDEKELKFVPERLRQAYERFGNTHILIPREILLNIPRNNYAQEEKFLHKLQVAVLHGLIQAVLRDYMEKSTSIPAMPRDYFASITVKDNLQAKRIALKMIGAVIARKDIEKTGLNWNEVKIKLIQNNLALEVESGDKEICFTADLKEIEALLKEIFENNFEKLLPVLKQAVEDKYKNISEEELKPFIENPVMFFELMTYIPFYSEEHNGQVTLHRIRELLLEQAQLRKAREEAARLQDPGSLQDIFSGKSNFSQAFLEEITEAAGGVGALLSGEIGGIIAGRVKERVNQEQDAQALLKTLPSGAREIFDMLTWKVLKAVGVKKPVVEYYAKDDGNVAQQGMSLIRWNLFAMISKIKNIHAVYQSQPDLEEAYKSNNTDLTYFFETIVHESQHLSKFETPGDHTHHSDENIDTGFAARMGKAIDKILFYLSSEDFMSWQKEMPKIDDKDDGGGQTNEAESNNLGGVDFRMALPPGALLGNQPNLIQRTGMPVDLGLEKGNLDSMIKARMLPSVNRLGNYLAGCCIEAGIQIHKKELLVLLAKYMRVQEGKNILTENEVKEWVIWLEESAVTPDFN